MLFLWDIDGLNKIQASCLNGLASYSKIYNTIYFVGFFGVCFLFFGFFLVQGEWNNLFRFQLFSPSAKHKQNKNLWNLKSLSLLSNNPITFTQVSKTRWISVPALCHIQQLPQVLRQFVSNFLFHQKLQKFPQFPLASWSLLFICQCA